MLAPAMMPVTAGKKTAKTVQKSACSKPPISGTLSSGIVLMGEKAMETSESAIIAMTTYWTRMAK